MEKLLLQTDPIQTAKLKKILNFNCVRLLSNFLRSAGPNGQTKTTVVVVVTRWN